MFVAIGNYVELFADGRFYLALRNNAVLIIFYCIVPLVVGICLAATISVVRQRERLALRTLLFMPYIMPTAVLGIIWQWLYNPAFGPIDQGLRLMGLGKLALPWLGDFTFVLPGGRRRRDLVFLRLLHGGVPYRHAAYRPAAL